MKKKEAGKQMYVANRESRQSSVAVSSWSESRSAVSVLPVPSLVQGSSSRVPAPSRFATSRRRGKRSIVAYVLC